MEIQGNEMTGTSKTKRSYQMLTRNMVLFVVAVSLIPLVVIGTITLNNFSVAYSLKVRDHLRELMLKHSHNIDRFLTNRLGDLRVLARSSDLKQLLEVSFLQDRLQVLREEYDRAFVDLGVVDQQGRQVAYVGPFSLLGADYSQAEWFRQAMTSEFFISDVFAGLRGAPHFIVSARKHQGDRHVLVKATIDFEAFNALVEKFSIGSTGFAFILNRKGQFQTKPRYDVVLDRGPYRDLLDGRLKAGRIPVLERPDAHDNQAIFAMAPLKEGQWILCLQQQTSDAYAHMHDTVKLALFIIVVSALIIVALALYLSRRLVGRIAEADQQREVLSEKVIETGRMASIGELAAGIAHEINNPVAIMVEEAGWIEDILAEDGPIGEEELGEIQRAVQQIRAQGGRCKDITYKLLSFARKTDPTASEVSVNGLVGEVVSLLSQKSRYANVQIITDLDPELPSVWASPSELQQVLLNLMNNAVDAMDQEGGQVTVRSLVRDGRVNLEVSDTGQGIPESYLPRIFDPFFTTKPVGKGTGLGLSICYGIIHKLGGDIQVRSEVQKGTTFTVRMPPRHDRESQAPAAETQDESIPGAPGNQAN